MKWVEVSIKTSTYGSDIVSSLLEDFDCNGTVIEDINDALEHQATNKTWDIIDEDVLGAYGADVIVKAYFELNEETEALLYSIEGELGKLKARDTNNALGKLTYTSIHVNDEDWNNSWKKHFVPFRIGEKIVVCPSWETYQPKESEVMLSLDPGMAFGTGLHETTKLCLEMLEIEVSCEKNMLDIGTGSGILAIGALLLGAKHVTGVDIDETAVKVAQENAEINNVQSNIKLICGDLVEHIDCQYDIVCANIVADMIIRLLVDVKKYIKTGGVFIASGIIESRKDDVYDAFKLSGLKIESIKTMGEWVAIKAKKD